MFFLILNSTPIFRLLWNGQIMYPLPTMLHYRRPWKYRVYPFFQISNTILSSRATLHESSYIIIPQQAFLTWVLSSPDKTSSHLKTVSSLCCQTARDQFSLDVVSLPVWVTPSCFKIYQQKSSRCKNVCRWWGTIQVCLLSSGSHRPQDLNTNWGGSCLHTVSCPQMEQDSCRSDELGEVLETSLPLDMNSEVMNIPRCSEIRREKKLRLSYMERVAT